jgi:hypothetical protein
LFVLQSSSKVLLKSEGKKIHHRRTMDSDKMAQEPRSHLSRMIEAEAYMRKCKQIQTSQPKSFTININ